MDPNILAFSTRRVWQRVAGGRRGFCGRRPPDSGARVDLHPGWGARLISERPVMRARGGAYQGRVWHPRWGALSQNTSSGGRSPLAPYDHRLPSGNPPGWLRLQSGECPRLFRNGRHTVPNGLPAPGCLEPACRAAGGRYGDPINGRLFSAHFQGGVTFALSFPFAACTPP